MRTPGPSGFEAAVARGLVRPVAARAPAQHSFDGTIEGFLVQVDLSVFHHVQPKGTIHRVAIEVPFPGSLAVGAQITSSGRSGREFGELFTVAGNRDGVPLRDAMPEDLRQQLAAWQIAYGGVISVWDGGVRWEHTIWPSTDGAVDLVQRAATAASWAWRYIGSADAARRAQAPSALQGPQVLPLRNQIALVVVLVVLGVLVTGGVFLAAEEPLVALLPAAFFVIPLVVLVPFTLVRVLREG